MAYRVPVALLWQCGWYCSVLFLSFVSTWKAIGVLMLSTVDYLIWRLAYPSEGLSNGDVVENGVPWVSFPIGERDD